MAVMSNEQLSIFSFTENENGVKATSVETGKENDNRGVIINMPTQNDVPIVETGENVPTTAESPKKRKAKREKKEEEKKPKAKKEEKPKKRAVPENLLKMNDKTNPEEFFNQMGFEGIKIDTWSYVRGHFRIVNNVICQEKTVEYGHDLLLLTNDAETFNAEILYVEDDGYVWNATLTMELENRLRGQYAQCGGGMYFDSVKIKSISVGKWHQNTKVHRFANFMQKKDVLEDILQKNNPYAFKFCKDEKCPVTFYFQAPQVEILVKAGYSFPRRVYSAYHMEQSEYDCFNRLCKPGNNPKEIFKTSKVIYTTLKNEDNLHLWDTYRKLDKFGRIKPDTVQQVYDQGFSDKDLSSINSILNKTYKGKPVFTWDSLINYLGRLDTFEAIERYEAFMLLEDYLRMCGQLDIEPKIDGDSLKREHDVVARTIRQKRNEVLARQMQGTCDAMKVYDYNEKIYFIRAIRNYDDLIDEACQQHNCVASYANRIANRQSLIYVMREVNNPNRSLITVELTPDGKNIRQKFLAYNRPIHNKAQSEFLERWMKSIAGIKLPTKEKSENC